MGSQDGWGDFKAFLKAVAPYVFVAVIWALGYWLTDKFSINWRDHSWGNVKFLLGLLWKTLGWLVAMGFAVWAILAAGYHAKEWIMNRKALRDHPIFRGFFRIAIVISAIPILFVGLMVCLWIFSGPDGDMEWIVGMIIYGLLAALAPWVLFGVSMFIADGFMKKPNSPT